MVLALLLLKAVMVLATALAFHWTSSPPNPPVVEKERRTKGHFERTLRLQVLFLRTFVWATAVTEVASLLQRRLTNSKDPRIMPPTFVLGAIMRLPEAYLIASSATSLLLTSLIRSLSFIAFFKPFDMVTFTILPLLFLFFNLALAAPQAEPNCGTFIGDQEIKLVEKMAKEAMNKTKDAISTATSSIVFPVHFHVVAKDNTLKGGNAPDSQIHDQIQVLNQDYGPAGIAFQLVGITRLVHSEWHCKAVPSSPEQTAMKGSLRRGDVKTLNVYTVGFESSPGLLGYATFPWWHKGNPSDDGVVMLYSSLPGGSQSGYNGGRTLTHEAGHWMGLYHTFQGGCGGHGDYVDDTPPEAKPASGCPIGRTSCGKTPDPIHNFMDYTTDKCMNEFTPGEYFGL
ncbi:hypothetical protein ONZ45_g13361 [Pleurotus djamor]|nr:hypothetical protein ONZ45_g13361 [Pleurotus djamor]